VIAAEYDCPVDSIVLGSWRWIGGQRARVGRGAGAGSTGSGSSTITSGGVKREGAFHGEKRRSLPNRVASGEGLGSSSATAGRGSSRPPWPSTSIATRPSAAPPPSSQK
jgi:hypothetical protein